MDLLEFKKNKFSQNGEDGIIEKIFDVIGVKDKTCCEFGAWDGVHLCNVRNLIINHGWYGILIEGDSAKCAKIQQNYTSEQVCAINSFVDNKENSLDKLFDRCERVKNKDIDFLSVDIDGLDYLIFESLNIMPRVICIEVNAGHNPTELNHIPQVVAKVNVGQSLEYFNQIATGKGYSLVCYTGNAFYVRDELVLNSKLTEISPEQAYKDFISHLSKNEKEWLYLTNRAMVEPYHLFNNPFLECDYLGLSDSDIKRLKKEHGFKLEDFVRKIKYSIRKRLS